MICWASTRTGSGTTPPSTSRTPLARASGPAPAIPPSRLAQGGSLFLTRPGLFDYVSTEPELDASAAALWEVIASGAVKIEIGSERPLAEVREAHVALEARETVGATLLIPA